MSKYLSFVIVVTLTTCSVDGLMFDLETKSSKCIRDETGQNVLVTGEYEVAHVNPHDPQHRVDYQVRALSLFVLNSAILVTCVVFPQPASCRFSLSSITC